MFSAIVQFFRKKQDPQEKVPFIKNWDIPRPEVLWFATNSNAEAKLTPLDQIESILGIKWTEVILGNAFEIKPITKLLKKNIDDLPVISIDEYRSRLNDFYKKCIIRRLDNKIGWIITLRPGETLDQGFITCYTGIITRHPLQQESSYLEREYYFSLVKTKKEEVVIDAKKCGNMSRLFPFLLEEDYLTHFDVDPAIKNKIAFATLEFKIALINQFKVPCIFAPKPITAPANQELLLGLNYSFEYLCKMQKDDKIFKLFNKDTFEQLDPQYYPQKMIQIVLEGFSYSFYLSRFRILVAQHQPQIELWTLGADEEKKKYYKITISNAQIYNTFLQSPEATVMTVKPTVRNIPYAEYIKILNQSEHKNKLKL